jgi:phosphatidylglycerol:prolipoprotein diacylglycerol transferase
LPWAVTFRNPVAHDLVGVPLGQPLHPTQLYESFAEFAIFAVLYRQIGKAHRQGATIGLYLMLYSTARFVVEFFRYHEQGNLWGTPLDASQWISLGLCGLGIWCFFRKEPKAAAPEKPARSVPVRR